MVDALPLARDANAISSSGLQCFDTDAEEQYDLKSVFSICQFLKAIFFTRAIFSFSSGTWTSVFATRPEHDDFHSHRLFQGNHVIDVQNCFFIPDSAAKL